MKKRLSLMKFNKEGLINRFGWTDDLTDIVTIKQNLRFRPSELTLTAFEDFVEKYISVYGAYLPEPTLTSISIAWERTSPIELSMTLACVSSGGFYSVSLPTLSVLQVSDRRDLICQFSDVAIAEWDAYQATIPKQTELPIESESIPELVRVY